MHLTSTKLTSEITQAHLGVRLKKEGYTVVGADWKHQEYFEEVLLLDFSVFIGCKSGS